MIPLIMACAFVGTEKFQCEGECDTAPLDVDTTGPVRDSLSINEIMARGSVSDWIELYNAGPEDVLLDGWSVTDDALVALPPVLSGGLVVPAGGFLVLWADGDPALGPDHLPFVLDGDGEEIALDDSTGQPIDRIRFGLQVEDLAAARLPDGSDVWGYVHGGTPGASNTTEVVDDGGDDVTDETGTETLAATLLDAGSTWRYATTHPGGAWSTSGFDDSQWSEGTAPLGFGDEHIETDVEGAPLWVRTTFDVPDASSIAGLELALLRDDGVVVYVNGVEVARDNLPSGDLDDATLALETVGSDGDDEETTYLAIPVPSTVLVSGTNVVAAAVYQADPKSSDLSFDLGIEAVGP